MSESGQDRVFVRARRPFRPGYSPTEVAVGAAIGCGLLAVAVWVGWRGAHPDPELSAAVPLERREARPADRGPFPADLAPAGWRELRLAAFDPSNVYVKIDGREAYYKSFGFQGLHCLTLAAPGGDPSVDLELYDLGSASNALGAAAGELPPGAAAELEGGTLSVVDRNALFLARGQYYLRAIGSSDAEPVRALLARLRTRFAAALPAGELPWAYALFLPLGVAPARVSFVSENAFSFAFASRVYVGLLGDGETELFATATPDPGAARALAARFARGFAEYGTPLATRAGVAWSRDRYLSRASAAGAVGRLVVGVHGAAEEVAGQALYAKLAAAARALPAPALARAAPRSTAQEE